MQDRHTATFPSSPSPTDPTTPPGPSWIALVWISAVLLVLGPVGDAAQYTDGDDDPKLQTAGFLQQQFLEGSPPEGGKLLGVQMQIIL